jgi:ADP-heptose:LPS heptosyltransferase
MYKELYFLGCDGFGDNVCQRVLIKGLAKSYHTIYLRTPAPEFYWDIPNVKFVFPNHLPPYFRIQKRNAERQKKEIWTSVSLDGIHKIFWTTCRMPYANNWMRGDAREVQERKDRLNGEFFKAYDSILDFDFSFPLKRSWVTGTKKLLESWNAEGKKVCLVNPPTVRRGYPPTYFLRNPKMEHTQLLIDKYKEEYYYISLAHTEEDEEWLDGELSGIDKELVRAEASLPIIFGLVKLADMMIVHPSFFALLAIALKTKCFCIFGGCKEPEELFDKKMGLEKFEHVIPTPFCVEPRAVDEYVSNKEIPEERIIEKFEDLRNRSG